MPKNQNLILSDINLTRNKVKVGSLIKIDAPNVLHVVKLYSKLQTLKNDPFMGCDKYFILAQGDELITIVTDVSNYIYANNNLKPLVEAVKIIVSGNVWWMFSYDIGEVIQ